MKDIMTGKIRPHISQLSEQDVIDLAKTGFLDARRHRRDLRKFKGYIDETVNVNESEQDEFALRVLHYHRWKRSEVEVKRLNEQILLLGMEIRLMEESAQSPSSPKSKSRFNKFRQWLASKIHPK